MPSKTLNSATFISESSTTLAGKVCVLSGADMANVMDSLNRRNITPDNVIGMGYNTTGSYFFVVCVSG